MATVLAVDLGAESGRVMAVRAGDELQIQELARFPNRVVELQGTLYWDILRLWDDVRAGIGQGLALAPAGIGVDAWGVDFGLLDEHGELLGNPVCYRDRRTEGMPERAWKLVSREQIFERSGIQFMPINTLYQLLSLVERGSSQLRAAHTFLTIPDLLNYWLTGERVCEFSNATTTQLVDPRTREWAGDLIEALGIPRAIFPPIVQPGTLLGAYQGVPVIAPACHDTGSAVAAVPAGEQDFAYISSGTWSLVGLETNQPLFTPAARDANLTNEGGVAGTFRLLKNVMGLWIVQQCRATWRRAGKDYSYDELGRMAEAAVPLRSIIDPDDGRFLPPGDHPRLIADLCRAGGQAVPDDPGAVVRCVLESLALAYRDVLSSLQQAADRRVNVIHVVGGGSRNELLCRLTADATGLPVVAGPVEATVLGNALMQLIALGELSDLAAGRRLIAAGAELRRYEPRSAAGWDAAYRTFQELRIQNRERTSQ